MVHDGKRVSLALKNIRRKQPYPQDDWYRFNMRPMTDAEFTFMLRQPFPKKVRFVVKSMGSTHMNVFLNHDLTYYERFEDLDRHRVAQGVSLPDRGWSTVDVVLPPDLLRQGLNKIGFLFSSCKPPDSRLVKADESPAPICAALEKATFL